MTNLWLYPFSKQSGYWPRGQSVRESFSGMIESGGGWWTITDHYREVEPGDRLVIYETKTSNNPPELMGTARVSKGWRWNGRRKTHEIEVELDREVCRRVLKKPISAAYLTEHLHRRKRPVVALDASAQRWVVSKLNIEPAAIDPEVSDVIRTEARAIKVRARAYEALLRHDPHVIVPLRQRLERAGWKVLPSRPADLIATNARGSRRLLVEGKTISSRGGRIDIRYAIGQLLDYEFFVLPTLGLGDTKCDRLVLLEKKPAAKFIAFVESLGIGLAWLRQSKITGGPLAMRMLKGT